MNISSKFQRREIMHKPWSANTVPSSSQMSSFWRSIMSRSTPRLTLSRSFRRKRRFKSSEMFHKKSSLISKSDSKKSCLQAWSRTWSRIWLEALVAWRRKSWKSEQSKVGLKASVKLQRWNKGVLISLWVIALSCCSSTRHSGTSSWTIMRFQSKSWSKPPLQTRCDRERRNKKLNWRNS